ncbi:MULTISPECIES: ABC transporter ATP-binding protein [Rhizobium/Agrobacterium group]|uniref:ABC transporter ATP-binding protein n=2 Tax=Rhizobium/Agrobacterium group TaxID=227290 RepID=A0A1B9TYC1_AGRTU|nr:MULTISPECIES: ABC transporter ATP-binding protein [Rhizobium/Agrobacterium group]ARU12490.1 ABC transport ATP-binding protein [Agrobacterium tumefaciens]MBB3947463.1 peptide/nickel transport system ATP-binding protein [Rhizobium skierniewicense]NSL21095.1 ABC transporter ATP-binding protein [Agrobacterium tumefaciens]NSY52207.1 ABC transporter ATP-binding protein [Agrobacterium tumefaciens]NSZ09954.1 ABC transporter ATP-binding protein [Agrobacterium tumefaciens]
MLEVKNLSIAFKTGTGLRSAVRNMDFTIRPGEILGLVGESGSGKTITSLAVMGLLPPNAAVTGGEVLVDGVDILKLSSAELRRLRGSHIAMIFQDPIASLDPIFTCGDQIVEAILLHEPIGRGNARRKARELLEKVLIPDPDRAMRSYPHELSGGQCQRIMIAMAVACRPHIIIADEPTTALDVTVQKQVLELLRELNADVGAAILLITHDLGVIYEVADRVVVMYAGDKMEEATTADLFSRPQSDYSRALIDSMPSLGGDAERLPVIERDSTGKARSVRPEPRRRPASSGPIPIEADRPLLEIRDLCKSYWLKPSPLAMPVEMRAVDRVSLSVAPRTTLGLVGESGCGKSTLSRAVIRLFKPDSGKILFKGKDIAGLSDRDMLPFRREIAMVFQNPYGSLNPRQTVAQLVEAPMVIFANGDASERQARVRTLLEAVGLPATAAQKYPHEFSGGQRQRIAIARALALNPSLVICDEAVSALDVSVQAQVLNLLKDLQAEFDLTYLFISHDLSVVKYVSDTVAVMRKGRIVESGETSAVFSDPQDAYTRMLLEAVPTVGSTLGGKEGA